MLAMMLSSTGLALTPWQITADVLFHALALLPLAVAGWALLHDVVENPAVRPAAAPAPLRADATGHAH